MSDPLESEALKLQAAKDDGVHVLAYLTTLARAYPGRVDAGLLKFLEAGLSCPFNADTLARDMVRAAQTR